MAETLGLALDQHRAGHLQQAERLYRQILEANPRHADALHLLGVLIAQLGRHDLAVAYIEQALTVKPNTAAFHNNLGFSYQALGRLDEALSQYQQAVRLQPDFAGAHNNLGNVHRAQGRVEDAARSYRHALNLQPDDALAHNNLGVALQELGKPNEAVAWHHQAIRLKPDFIDAYNNLGVALQALKKLDEALATFQHALRLKPDDPEAHSNMGNVLKEQGKLDEAVAYYREAVRLKPSYAVAHNNLAFALQEQGKYDAAMGCYGQALGLEPDLAVAHWNRSLLRLMLGDFEQGWPEYEWRWTQPIFTRRPFHRPRWDGSDLGGQTILLHVEQGFGDMIQFVRYVPLVKQRGGKVIVECHPPLVRLLAGVQEIDCLVALGSPLPAFDVQAPLVSLPLIFHTPLATVPAPVPYLHADADLGKHWRLELNKGLGARDEGRESSMTRSSLAPRPSPLAPFLVGIAWQGNPTYRADRQRSIPLAHFARLAQVPGVQLLSLQKGPGTEQLRALSGQFPVVDLDSRLDEASGAFMDTAAVMKNLDLVISSDTAVPHLAGALGVPVWLALPYVPDWRWLLEREDCPWYPTMRLFRQTRYGQWEDVFDRMAEELKTCRLVQKR